MLFKRSIALLLAVVLCFSLAACGQSNAAKPDQESKPASSTEVEVSNEPAQKFGEGKRIMLALNALGDLSFNDLLYDGLLGAEEALGFEVSYSEVGTDISTYEGYFFDFCAEGYDYVFLRSGFLDLCKQYAADYPDMKFIVYDTTSLDECEADNVYLYATASYESAYLVGMAAAGASKTGVVGFVGGQENPVLNDFLVGYIQGAKAYNPDIKVYSAFIGNFNDTAKALEIATSQINTYKADVVFAVCGGASLGVFQACYDNNVFAIGCDADQYVVYNKRGEAKLAENIITSCLKKMDSSVLNIMTWISEGQDIFAGTKAVPLGLSDGVVGIADNDNYQKLVPEEVRTKVAAAEQDVINGTIKVQSAYDMTQSEIDALVESVTP